MPAKGLFCIKPRTREVHEVETLSGGDSQQLAGVMGFRLQASADVQLRAVILVSSYVTQQRSSLSARVFRQFMFNTKSNYVLSVEGESEKKKEPFTKVLAVGYPQQRETHLIPLYSFECCCQHGVDTDHPSPPPVHVSAGGSLKSS